MEILKNDEIRHAILELLDKEEYKFPLGCGLTVFGLQTALPISEDQALVNLNYLLGKEFVQKISGRYMITVHGTDVIENRTESMSKYPFLNERYHTVVISGTLIHADVMTAGSIEGKGAYTVIGDGNIVDSEVKSFEQICDQLENKQSITAQKKEEIKSQLKDLQAGLSKLEKSAKWLKENAGDIASIAIKVAKEIINAI